MELFKVMRSQAFMERSDHLLDLGVFWRLTSDNSLLKMRSLFYKFNVLVLFHAD